MEDISYDDDFKAKPKKSAIGTIQHRAVQDLRQLSPEAQ